jgi:Bardet-Biedl syndrome 1 protein
MLRLLQLPTEDLETFTNQHKHTVLKKQTVITCISTLKKSHSEENSVSCLVIGTEASHVYVLDSQAFSILATVSSSVSALLTNLLCMNLIR